MLIQRKTAEYLENMSAAAGGAGAGAAATRAGLVVCYINRRIRNFLIGKETTTIQGEEYNGKDLNKKLSSDTETIIGDPLLHCNYINKPPEEAVFDFYNIAKHLSRGERRVQFKDIGYKTGTSYTQFREVNSSAFKYGFPKGGQKVDDYENPTESLKQTALREATEEIGFNFSTLIDHARLKDIGVHKKYQFYLLCINSAEYDAINDSIAKAERFYYGEVSHRMITPISRREQLNPISSDVYGSLSKDICNEVIPTIAVTDHLINTLAVLNAAGMAAGRAGAVAVAAPEAGAGVAAGGAGAGAGAAREAAGGAGNAAGGAGERPILEWRVPRKKEEAVSPEVKREIARIEAEIESIQAELNSTPSGIKKIPIRIKLASAEQALRKLKPSRGGSRKKLRKNTRKTRRQTLK